MKFLLIVNLILVSLLQKISAQGRALKSVSLDRRIVEDYYKRNEHYVFWDKEDRRTACFDVYRARNEVILKDCPILRDISNSAQCTVFVPLKFRNIIYQFDDSRNGYSSIVRCECGSNVRCKKTQLMDQSLLDMRSNATAIFYILRSELGTSYYVLIDANRPDSQGNQQFHVTEYWKYQDG